MLACTALQHLVPRPGIDDAADRPSVVCTLCWAVSVRQIRMNTWHLQKSEGRFLHINDAIEGVFVSLWCTIFFSRTGAFTFICFIFRGASPLRRYLLRKYAPSSVRNIKYASSFAQSASTCAFDLLTGLFIRAIRRMALIPAPPMRGYAPQRPNLALFRDLLVIYIGI